MRSDRAVRSGQFPRLLGAGALFSGSALLAQIVAGLPLRLGLAASTGLLLLALVVLWRRASSDKRRWFIDVIKIGAAGGVLATVAYDLARYGLSQWDPSPYNPFEALRVFGLLLAGSGATPAVIYTSGAAFHTLNGISFGVAFCFFFGTRGILAGIGWGIFLELFQIALYPNWLDIKAVKEFTQISALSHVAYGAVLGVICRHGLRSHAARAAAAPQSARERRA